LFKDRTHSVPGFLNPVEPKNYNRRRFSDPTGRIEFQILPPRPQQLEFPSLKAILSSNWGREIDVLLNDQTGCLLFRKEEPNRMESFWIRIDQTQYLVSRGSYLLSVYENDRQINSFDVIVKNNPLRVDAQDYIWVVG